MSTPSSHHFVGPPFWIGCAVTPVLIAFAAWPLDGAVPIFVWLITSAVFAGIIGAFTQAIADLLRAHKQSRLTWIESLFLGIIVVFAAVYGCALYFFPATEHFLRYGVVAAIPLLIAGFYTRIRFCVFSRRHGSPDV
jgi:uncharacterized membrane protein YfcA